MVFFRSKIKVRGNFYIIRVRWQIFYFPGTRLFLRSKSKREQKWHAPSGARFSRSVKKKSDNGGGGGGDKVPANRKNVHNARISNFDSRVCRTPWIFLAFFLSCGGTSPSRPAFELFFLFSTIVTKWNFQSFTSVKGKNFVPFTMIIFNNYYLLAKRYIIVAQN